MAQTHKTTPPSGTAARDTLQDIVSSLRKVTAPEHSPRVTSSRDSGEVRGKVKCSVCRQPIEPGAFFIALSCCGAFAHVLCISEAASAATGRPCASCLATYLADESQVCQKLAEQIASVECVI
jgi:hypothetical protein